MSAPLELNAPSMTWKGQKLNTTQEAQEIGREAKQNSSVS